jgi:hypothetical protein
MNATTLSIKEQIAQIAATIEALQIQKSQLETQLAIEEAVATKQQEPTPEVVVEAKPKASRVKRSKQVDTMVKGKRDIDAGTAAKIDEMKAQDVKPAKVAQEKRSTKPTIAEKAKKQPGGRKHEGMTYAQVRNEVSARKAKLNKADQERMSKAGLKNNTWEGAIASLEWLNKYFTK